MAEIKMGVVESHFADIIWANEPLHSRDLVKLCEKELNWNRSTTYTVLRKLCERGIFQNNGGTVSSVLTKNEFYAVQSEQFVDETFEGSLPAFIAAFTQRKGISQQEAAEIRHMIDAAARKGVIYEFTLFENCKYEYRRILADPCGRTFACSFERGT